MNRNIKKILSIILVFTTICSILTISYASGAINAITKPIVNIIDNIAPQAITRMSSNSENDSEAITMSENTVDTLGKIEAASDSGRITATKPPKAQTMSIASTDSTNSAEQEPIISEKTEMTTAEITSFRTEKLQALTTKYPNEYTLLTEKSEIEADYYVNLLEMYDFWEIEDFDSYLDSFISDGFSGLEAHHVTPRERSNENE